MKNSIPLSHLFCLFFSKILSGYNMRGHNVYDIFYGRYKKEETVLLKKYIDLAPREDFADILDAIDRFVYFDSRRRAGE